MQTRKAGHLLEVTPSEKELGGWLNYVKDFYGTLGCL